jgi:UMF1 family MFS transporter
MLITAGIFACASLPTFAFLRERAQPQRGPHRLMQESLGRVFGTLRAARRYRDLRAFLACIVLYQAGIQTVVALAAVYAEQAMGFTTADTLRLILVVNVMAAVGAFAFGYVQDRIGHIRALAGTLGGWLVAVVLAWAADGPALFWAAASVVGACLGSSQSGGRALVGYMTPEDKRAEFFGLWGMAVKLSAILGPMTYGAATWMSGGDHRLAILTTGIYFVLGLVLLLAIDAERGRRAALEPSAVK